MVLLVIIYLVWIWLLVLILFDWFWGVCFGLVVLCLVVSV